MKIIEENPSWGPLIYADTLAKWPNEILLVSAEKAASVDWPKNQCIAIADAGFPKDAVIDLITQGIGHVVQIEHPRFDHSVQFAAHLISQTHSALDNFSEAYFGPLGTKYHLVHVPFRHSNEKNQSVAQVLKALEQIPKTANLKSMVGLITDELYTNAIFNAPTDKEGRRKYTKFKRTTAVEIDPGASARIFLANNGEILLLGCEDSYGSIDFTIVLEKLKNCFKQGVSTSMNFGRGGAGIGCYMMFDQSSGFYVARNPGQKTVVAVELLLGKSSKSLAMLPKNIHFARVG